MECGRPYEEDKGLEEFDYHENPEFGLPRDICLKSGDILNDRYKIVEYIGEGGMSLVFKVEDLDCGEFFALKVSKIPLSRQKGDVCRQEIDLGKRFEIEWKSSLELGYVCKEFYPCVYGLIDDVNHDVRGILMDIYEEDNWSLLADVFGRYTSKYTDIAKMGIKIAGALSVAHKKGIVLRDLKPGNIFVNSSGKVKLIDMGLVDAWNSLELDIPGMAVGTPGYMSPEAILGNATDERSDLYALGHVLYDLINGSSVFDYETVRETLSAQVSKVISWENIETPDALVRIVEKLLAKDPQDRYQNAEELVLALSIYLMEQDSTQMMQSPLYTG